MEKFDSPSKSIPKDIIREILKHLPVNSILRFRCLSKWSKQSIDSQSFVQDHLAVQKNRRFLLKQSIVSDRGFVVLDPQTFDVETLTVPRRKFFLVGTLHGIICMSNYYSKIMLWNPSIRESSFIRHNNFDYDIYDRILSAFWIDPSKNAYKVIIIGWRRRKPVSGVGDAPGVGRATLYSSIVKGWSEIALGISMKYVPHRECTPVVLGNIAYWSYNHFDDKAALSVFVICFDFDLEAFGDIIQGPSIRHAIDEYHPAISICQGKLSLVYFDKRLSTCDIYSRLEGSWNKMLTFQFPSYISPCRVLWALVDEIGDTQDCQILAATTQDDLVICDTKGCVYLEREIRDVFHISVVDYDFVSSLLPTGPISQLIAGDP